MIASERFARTVQRVTLASALVAVLCIAAAIALTLLGRPGASVGQVQVTDDASVVDPIRLEEEIGALSTYAPVRVVVWTRDGEASDNINAEALDWARAQPEKELLSPDSRKWADGLLGRPSTLRPPSRSVTPAAPRSIAQPSGRGSPPAAPAVRTGASDPPAAGSPVPAAPPGSEMTTRRCCRWHSSDEGTRGSHERGV